MNKLYKIFLILFFIPILISCATTVSKKTYIDARLMPEDVARDILERDLKLTSFEGFYMYPHNKSIDPFSYTFCDHQNPKYFSFNDIEIIEWDKSVTYNITLASKEKFDYIDYPCTNPVSSSYKKYSSTLDVNEEQEQDDIISALLSLGISIKVQEDQ